MIIILLLIYTSVYTNLFLKKKKTILSDKPANLEGLGSFDVEPQIAGWKVPTF